MRKNRIRVEVGSQAEKDIIKAYVDKIGIEKIKERFNISLAEFYRIINRNNIKKRRRFQNVNVKDAVKLILSGLSDEEVADKLKCNPISIQKIRLRETDIRYYTKRKIEGRPQEKRITLNRPYKEKDDSQINLHNCGWDGLAKTIVYQAVADYKKIQRVVNRTGRLSNDIRCERIGLRRFANSEWCKQLTNIDLNSIFDGIEDGRINC